MFKKSLKISTQEFQTVYPKSKKVFTPLFRLGFLESPKTHHQYAVVIPKKIIKKAFARKREKRRIYAGLRTHQDLLPKKSYYILLFLQKDTKNMNHIELSHALQNIIKKAF